MLWIAGVCAAALAGCAPGYTFRNPDLPPHDLGKGKVLLLPVDVRGLTGKEDTLVARVLEGGRSVFGKRLVDLAPASPSFIAAGLEDLGWETGTGMLYLLDEKELFDFTKDPSPAGRGLAELPAKLARLAGIAQKKFDLAEKPGFLLCLNVQGRGKGVLEGTVKFRLLAGLYSLTAGQIHAFVILHDSTADDPKTVKTTLRDAAAEALETLADLAREPGD
jgi:hypothetical protein